MATIQAIIWDLGGVIVRTTDRSWRSEWEERLGLGEYELERAVFDSRSSRRAGVGQGTSDDVWAELGQSFALDPQQLAALREDFWRGDVLDERLLDYLRKLRENHQVAMISNAWPETRELIQEVWQLEPLFDEIVLSAEVGLAKPDPAIFELALERLRVAARSAIFVDDFGENVEAAQALGMHAVKFEDRRQAIQDVDRILAAHA